MARHSGTWNHLDWNFQINGVPLTDFNGDVTFSAAEDDWEFTQGQNYATERSLHENRSFDISFPMMATSPQLDLVEALAVADKKAGVGPYPFSAVHLITGASGIEGYKLVGQATIAQIDPPSVGKVGSARTIKLHVDAELMWRGA